MEARAPGSHNGIILTGICRQGRVCEDLDKSSEIDKNCPASASPENWHISTSILNLNA